MKKKNNKKNLIIGIVVAVVAIIAIVLCLIFFKKDDSGQTVIDKVTRPSGVSLLTGEPMEEEQACKRPYAVMIENTKTCQNTYGLTSAGVVYEAPAEGGITRLLAIFDNFEGVNKIGNIRSCRPYYAYFAAEFQAIYVHFGQSVQGAAVLDSGIVNNLSGLDGSINSTFFRTDEHKAPHNAYTDPDRLKAGTEKKGYSTEYTEDYTGHYLFADEDKPNKLSDGKKCTVVCPYFYNNKPHFEYNSETGLYERYQFSGKHIDANNNEQVKVKNIIFQVVPSQKYSETEASGYLDINLLGKGEGKYFTNGKYIDITWKKDSYTSATKYYDSEGNEIELNPGKTWVCIIEASGLDKCKYYETLDEYKASK